MASSVRILPSEQASLLPKPVAKPTPSETMNDPVQLAHAIAGGSLLIDDLEFQHGMGVRFLRTPAHATMEQLRGEVHCLRSSVANAVARGELRDPDLVMQIETALARVDRELTRSRPSCDAVVPNLRRASDLLLGHFSHKPTPALPGSRRLAPVAATAWATSVRLFEV